ncbi:Emopamil-binding protein [Saccharata proteae CBS 121410]|uniref:Emopamil-binding protein n=1 Tax=Saccharata proteae CBS 121410 TaxID=1314787 RepID=A0A9P4LV18_9PEZI|nr:Emopamil-binding protein [Saccharata proteae CBS 121410]
MEIVLNATKLPHPPHPYYPLEVEIIGYLANDWTVPALLASFAAGCALIFGVTYVLVKRTRPQLPATELLTILWFVLSGAIHLFFEGFYVYNFRDLGGSQHLFGQLWKEYALSDSRYLTQDPFVLCMETITAVCWGPLSFTLAALIAWEHPMRYPLQAIVSLGQLYGDVLYYATSLFDHYLMDLSYSRPEAYYFWVYFVLMNAFWIAIPLALIFSSVKHSARAIEAVSKVEKSLKKNGALKKGQ